MDGHRRFDPKSLSRSPATNDSNIGHRMDGHLGFRDDGQRANLYGVIARIFYEAITPSLAAELERSHFLTVMLGGKTGQDNRRIGFLDLDELGAEFTRLFIGPNPAAPPYATFYREDDPFFGQTWGKLTGEVKRFMSFYGIETAGEGTIPDHISIIFEFMEKVIEAGIPAAASGYCGRYEESRKIQKRFFKNYIDPWVSTFFRRVLDADPPPFYATASEFADQFVRCEKILLSACESG